MRWQYRKITAKNDINKPASGENRGSRNQRRAYEYQQSQNFRRDWNEVREFEDRPQKPRGKTARSAAWKQKQQAKKLEKQEAKNDAAAAYTFKAKDETAPVDEPLYDLGPHSNSIPVQETYSQNFEFGGFIDQVERTYEALRGVDPRLDRRMPFSMFQHSTTTILNCYLIDLTLENGERKLDSARCQDLLPEDLCVPDNLYHYMASVGNKTTVNGEEIRFNLPDIAIPQVANGDVPAGSFGPVTPETHNVYECYISPLVTSNRVLNTRRPPGEPEIPPLPLRLIPPGATPTVNLLGHGPPDVLPVEARHRIEGFDFPDGDSVAARLRICPELMSRFLRERPTLWSKFDAQFEKIRNSQPVKEVRLQRIKKSTLRRISKRDFNLKAYKIQLVQKLKPQDANNRLSFVNQMLDLFTNFNNVMFSDEAIFDLNGHVNKPNCRFWSETNPQRLQIRPLHSPKLVV
ncbi:unnamed protein product [Euphydryas editha]|uniref:Uncharacterized protein n=1 Tax=Euphydryas editha TaxID=104508 RepID=A0AAU9UPQ3_EUPED|nr:unnamed protein product [Euphydryas editha]